ncbi:MAG: adenylyltransferase/cytidyltransferase family protein [Anaerolineae bacterium]|jgi:rfaE bifunctional protein nucleotidyltransferase chain/domain|nr:adenylyltransferase/cytidyltransferase family protein [Anaerolineae bacterium]
MNVMTLDEAISQREQWRGRTLVITNGHFDLLHIGHLDYLEKARALGDALWIGLNGDASTEQLKGPGRPITPADERARLLSALRPVDGVIVFHERTAENLVRALRPEIYVKGGDYGTSDQGLVKPLPEAEIVRAYGGQVVLIPYLPGHSTSAVIQKVKSLP